MHGNLGTEGAVRAIESITTGLSWARVAAPLEITGQPGKAELDACWELGATVAATLLG